MAIVLASLIRPELISLSISPSGTLTTWIFIVAMWLMARRKVESWIFLNIGDLISIPLYLYKGLAITTIQYFIFRIIAVMGYKSWVKIYKGRITV